MERTNVARGNNIATLLDQLHNTPTTLHETHCNCELTSILTFLITGIKNTLDEKLNEINEKLTQVQAENQLLKEENEKLMKITGKQNDRPNWPLRKTPWAGFTNVVLS